MGLGSGFVDPIGAGNGTCRQGALTVHRRQAMPRFLFADTAPTPQLAVLVSSTSQACTEIIA